MMEKINYGTSHRFDSRMEIFFQPCMAHATPYPVKSGMQSKEGTGLARGHKFFWREVPGANTMEILNFVFRLQNESGSSFSPFFYPSSSSSSTWPTKKKYSTAWLM
jgi:hypothetical protein